MVGHMIENPAPGNIPQWTRGDRMMKALHHADMTVTEMAEYLDVSRTTVANWTSGRTPAPKMALMQWALRTGVPLVWIETGGTDEKTPGPKGPGGKAGKAKKSFLSESNRRPFHYNDHETAAGVRFLAPLRSGVAA